MSLGNWMDCCWDANARPVDVVVVPVRGGREVRPGCRPTVSILKHYLTITDERDDVSMAAQERLLARVHSGVVSLRGFTIVAAELDPSKGEEGPALFGGPGIMFLAFVGDDWAFHGPEHGLAGGGVGFFDPHARLGVQAATAFAEWVRSLEFGDAVAQWVTKATAPDAWRPK